MASGRRYVWLGAAYGVVAWGAYAVGEIAAVKLRPLVQHYADLISPIHWEFTAMVTAGYIVLGLMLGAVAGFLLRRRAGGDPGEPPFQEAAALSLVLAYLANLLLVPKWEIRAFIALAVGILLLAATALAMRRRRGYWAVWLTEPWPVMVILLGAPLLGGSLSARTLGGFLIVLIAIGLVSRMLLGRFRPHGFPVFQVVAVAVGLVVVAFATLSVEAKQPPLEIEHRSSEANKRPNLVLIVLDTVRADHLPLYGYQRDTAPFLSEFARQATLYRRPVSTSNYTLPTHATMFTGLHARSHGAINYPPGTEIFHPLNRNKTTLAEILVEKGYNTAAVVANTVFVRFEFGLNQGFRFFDVRSLLPCLPQRAYHYLRHSMRRLTDILWPRLEFDHHTRQGQEINDEALTLLPELKQANAPFFLFINFMDAHGPYLPPSPFDTRYPGRDRRMNYTRHPEVMEQVNGQHRKMTEAEHTHYISQYDGSIAYLDTQLRRLMERLRTMGLLDNTMVIVTSDHGEAFGEHGFFSHGISLYQQQVFVPLVIKYPGQQSGRTVDQLVSLVDLMPTILDTLGVEPPANLHGRSLARIDGAAPVPVYAEAYSPAWILEYRPKFLVHQRAVFSDNFKVISTSPGTAELYDLSKDPNEQRDLASAEGEQSRKLLTALDEWMKRVPSELAAVARDVDPSTLERLKALGYVK